MAKKYLTLRAEFVETGQRDCENCIFGVSCFDDIVLCGMLTHPKFNQIHCETGYYQEIDLTK